MSTSQIPDRNPFRLRNLSLISGMMLLLLACRGQEGFKLPKRYQEQISHGKKDYRHPIFNSQGTKAYAALQIPGAYSLFDIVEIDTASGVERNLVSFAAQDDLNLYQDRLLRYSPLVNQSTWIDVISLNSLEVSLPDEGSDLISLQPLRLEGTTLFALGTPSLNQGEAGARVSAGSPYFLVQLSLSDGSVDNTVVAYAPLADHAALGALSIAAIDKDYLVYSASIPCFDPSGPLANPSCVSLNANNLYVLNLSNFTSRRLPSIGSAVGRLGGTPRSLYYADPIFPPGLAPFTPEPLPTETVLRKLDLSTGSNVDLLHIPANDGNYLTIRDGDDQELILSGDNASASVSSTTDPLPPPRLVRFTLASNQLTEVNLPTPTASDLAQARQYSGCDPKKKSCPTSLPFVRRNSTGALRVVLQIGIEGFATGNPAPLELLDFDSNNRLVRTRGFNTFTSSPYVQTSPDQTHEVGSLFVTDLSNPTPMQQITFDNVDHIGGVYSADSQWILFFSEDSTSGHVQLFRIHVE